VAQGEGLEFKPQYCKIIIIIITITISCFAEGKINMAKIGAVK
jgi:hypothetical protein